MLCVCLSQNVVNHKKQSISDNFSILNMFMEMASNKVQFSLVSGLVCKF